MENLRASETCQTPATVELRRTLPRLLAGAWRGSSLTILLHVDKQSTADHWPQIYTGRVGYRMGCGRGVEALLGMGVWGFAAEIFFKISRSNL